MLFELAVVMAPASTAASPSTGCAGLEAINPLCYAVSAVGSIGGSVVTSGVDAVLSGLSQWVASGAEWLLSQIGNVLTSTTTIDLGADWFKNHYQVMTALAGVVILPLLLVSTLQAVYRQNASQLLRAFFVQLPLALLLGAVAVQIVILCLSATDALCAEVGGGSGSDVKNLFSGMIKGLVVAVGDPSMATFVLLLVAILVAAAAFVLWLELLVRAAAVYVAVLFLPLALATLVWPSVSQSARRLVETLAALILSKFVIVATLSLAAGAVASGTAGGTAGGSSVASVLAGGALLVLATFVPFSILRLIPMIEAGAIGHLEGVRQRATASLTRVPRTAAQFALREGMATLGEAKLLAQAGRPGTHGAGDGMGILPSGSSGDGPGNDGDDDGGGLGGGGGLVTGPDRTEELLADFYGPAKPKGPIPLLPSPAEKRAALAAQRLAAEEPSPRAAVPPNPAAVDLPPGMSIIGRPGPHDRRYALSRDSGGGIVIHGLQPLLPKPEAEPTPRSDGS